jgi:phosphate-selective porin OprO and OprP
MIFRTYTHSFALLVLILLTAHTEVRAQDSAKETERPSPQAASEKAGKEGPKKETQPEKETEPASDQIKQLTSKIGELQSLIEQQQHAIAEMQKRIDAIDGKPRAVTVGLKDGQPAEAAQAQKSDPAPSPAANPQDKPAAVAGWDRNHAFLRSSDGSFETQITGYAQLDYRGYQSGDHPPNTFLIRRARIALEGRLNRFYEYKVESDFADTTSILLRDFYVRIHRIDEAQLTFGQFRVPISQEEIRSDGFQDFVERSMVNNLVPSRSPGVMLSGVIDKGTFEYQVGAFNGKGLLVQNNNGTPETAVRLRFAPWKNGDRFFAKGFIFGGAFTQGRSLGGTSVRGLTESRSITWFEPDTINGKYIRANGEFTWLLGPAALRAEYDQTNQRRENLGPAGTNLPGVVAKGYTAQFTYMLTGEDKPEAGTVTPKRNLFGEEKGGPGFGAWELKFRYANLQIDDATSKSNRAESFYFGPNWYMTRFVRFMLDFGIERFNDPLRSPKPGDKNFFVTLSRVQVAF